MKKVKFKDLKVGDHFTCYGDIFMNYDYPKICECVKDDEFTGMEIDGIRFGVDPHDEIIIE